MNRRTFISSTALLAVSKKIFSQGLTFPEPDPLLDYYQGFSNPADENKAGCYWWWLNGLIDREGIERDLTEFKDKGIMDILLVNSAGSNMPVGVQFLSDEWRELFRYALRRAKSLNIKIGVNLCSGWAMGGPWITPDIAGRWYLQSELKVSGPTKFHDRLPLPGNRVGYNNLHNAPGYKNYIDLPLHELDYRDTAVVAFPYSGNEKILDEERLDNITTRANRADASHGLKADELMETVTIPLESLATDGAVSKDSVIDLTQYFSADGTLNWDVPEGDWMIIRTGHRMTGSRLSIAQPEADGLSVGWLNGEGVIKQFEHLGKILLEDAKKEDFNLHFFADDSFEDGFPNWTDQIIAKFIHYRGYDPAPYLPALGGYIVDTLDVTGRFLLDYRKTVADCMADGHYKKFAELCHENGLLVQNESAGPSRSASMSMDGMKNLGRSDLPTGEFWLGIKHDEPDGLSENLSYWTRRLDDGYNKVCKMVASAAHIYGKPLASAESFTTYRHWKDSPATLKQSTDRAFCEGINRILIHTSTATRPQDGKPGYEYYAGTHFNPNVTWWEYATDFLDYIARCQYLLRRGKFIADALYYNGDTVPNVVGVKGSVKQLGEGYDYDVCNEEVLLTSVKVKDRLLTLPDGMQYSVLILPDNESMPEAILRKIQGLVKEGAVVVGKPPVKDSGLRNFPASDKHIQQIVLDVWGKCDGHTVVMNRYGSGSVYWGRSAHEVLNDIRVAPDFVSDLGSDTIDFIHRNDDAADIYFVSNRLNKEVKSMCTFRMSGRNPEIWHPVKGERIRDIAFKDIDSHTEISLKFAPFESFFILFPKRTQKRNSLSALPDYLKDVQVLKEISGSWTVDFDKEWGGPETITFDQLQDWSQHALDSIKYYSGKAIYQKDFQVDKQMTSYTKLFINLGVVKEIASVRLNGKDLGVIWTSPWRADITHAVKLGVNRLEIAVINLWPNRLIGDIGLQSSERLTRTNISFEKDQKLLPSGLLGPVTIEVI